MNYSFDVFTRDIWNRNVGRMEFKEFNAAKNSISTLVDAGFRIVFVKGICSECHGPDPELGRCWCGCECDHIDCVECS